MYAIFDDQSLNDTLTKDIVSFEQLGPGSSRRVVSRAQLFKTNDIVS